MMSYDVNLKYLNKKKYWMKELYERKFTIFGLYGNHDDPVNLIIHKEDEMKIFDWSKHH